MLQSARTTSRTLNEIDDFSSDNKFVVYQIIGEGLSSQVQNQFQWNQPGQNDYAMKVFKPNITRTDRVNEIRILNEMDHPNVLALICYDEDETPDWFISELYFEKDLFDFIAIANKPFSEPIARYIFKTLLEGLSYIHSRNVVHRDIKLENILFTQDDFTVKIVDFSFSCYKSDTRKARKVGTMGYMAPELFRDGMDMNAIDGEEAVKTDIFSLGVVLFIMMFAFPLFRSTDEHMRCPIWRLIKQRKWEKLWKEIEKKACGINGELKELLENMLEHEEDERWTLEQVARSQWINGEVASEDEYYHEMRYRSRLFDA